MKISILHLRDGLHYFETTIQGGKLHFQGEKIYPNDILVNVELNKFEKNIKCNVALRTTSHHVCDRCLGEYNRDFKGRFRVLFHIGKHDFATDEENVEMLSPDQREIDLTSYITEELILAIPMKALCRADCKGICPQCGAELNKEACSCEEQAADPRLEKLRTLLK